MISQRRVIGIDGRSMCILLSRSPNISQCASIVRPGKSFDAIQAWACSTGICWMTQSSEFSSFQARWVQYVDDHTGNLEANSSLTMSAWGRRWASQRRGTGGQFHGVVLSKWDTKFLVLGCYNRKRSPKTQTACRNWNCISVSYTGCDTWRDTDQFLRWASSELFVKSEVVCKRASARLSGIPFKPSQSTTQNVLGAGIQCYVSRGHIYESTVK